MKIEIPLEIQNLVMNTFMQSAAKNEEDGIKVRKTLEVFNKYGISTMTANKIIMELNDALNRQNDSCEP